VRPAIHPQPPSTGIADARTSAASNPCLRDSWVRHCLEVRVAVHIATKALRYWNDPSSAAFPHRSTSERPKSPIAISIPPVYLNLRNCRTSTIFTRRRSSTFTPYEAKNDLEPSVPPWQITPDIYRDLVPLALSFTTHCDDPSEPDPYVSVHPRAKAARVSADSQRGRNASLHNCRPLPILSRWYGKASCSVYGFRLARQHHKVGYSCCGCK
jgi:hypothetical protein